MEKSKKASQTRTYTLQHVDGTAVTAQEVYNAFMSGPVFLYAEMRYLVPTGWAWVDINSTQDDPTNVGLVVIQTSEISTIYVGDKSLGGQ